MSELSFKAKLYRAFELLGDTLNTERSILGAFSEKANKVWAQAEQEQSLPLSDIAELQDINGVKSYNPKIPMHPDVWRELARMYPKLATGEALDARKDKFNSNILPKIGSAINEAILEVGMTYGARINADGKYDESRSAIADDVIIATTIYKTVGKTLKSLQLDEGKTQKVDDKVVRERFGDAVLEKLHGLQDAMKSFDDAMGSKTDGEKQALLQSIDPAYTNAVLAIKSAELKEVVRIKSYRVLEAIEGYTHVPPKDHDVIKKELAAKLSALGLDSENPALAQDELLAKKQKEVKAALTLNGLEKAVSDPVRNRQVAIVDQVLAGAMDASRMVGYEGPEGNRNGQALAMFHRDLPVMNFAVKGQENANATLIKALMEASRYHHNGYRKGNNSIIGHLTQTFSTGSRGLGEALRPIVATILVLHDLAEDGGPEVAGLNNSLSMIRDRFSPLVAELVADLTDAADKKTSHEQGAEKARKTLASENFVFADIDPRWTNPERPLEPTNPDRPYALTNAGPKIADRRSTMTEMLRDPEAMSGYSANSGWRLGWRLGSKGFVDDVVAHITDQVQKFDRNPDGFVLPAATVKERKSLIEGLRNSLQDEYKVDDLFMVQNLTIIADEFGLSENERKQFIRSFTNPDMPWLEFKETVLDPILTDERIKDQVAEGKTPGMDYSTMYKRAEKRGESPVRSDDNLHKYRDSFMRRLEMRQQIGVPPLDMVEGPEVKAMLAYYDNAMGNSGRDVVDKPVAATGAGRG
jgi:hypothetical protein